MRRLAQSDNTSYPLTDLMTSLMVIFVLLLLVFLNNQASGTRGSPANALLADLRNTLDLPSGNFAVVHESGDSYSVVIGTGVTFQPGKHDLSAGDAAFLKTQFPRIAKMVCDDKYRERVEELAVEGQADGLRYRGSSHEDSLSRNLELSQERSMEVVRASILPIVGEFSIRQCLEEKISANGRSEPETELDSAENRRVIFKIRMRSASASITAVAPPPGPEVLKMLELFRQLRVTPRQPVAFRLTEDDINAYMEYALVTNPRPGIESIKIRLFRSNYVAMLIRLDLDAIKRRGISGLLLSLQPFVSGRKELGLDFRFAVKDARMTFALEKAYYQQTAIPMALARQIIHVAAALQPEHFDSNDPIPLPFHLRHLRTEERLLMGEN